MSFRCTRLEPVQELDKLLYKSKTRKDEAFVEIGEEKLILPIRYVDVADEIENMEIRDSDVFVTSHPRSGKSFCLIF